MHLHWSFRSTYFGVEEEVEVVDEAKGNVKQYLWNVVLIGEGGGGRGYKDN